MHPDSESMLQEASPLPRCPITPRAPGLYFCVSFGRESFVLGSLALRSASVVAYGGGASMIGGEAGAAVFDMLVGVIRSVSRHVEREMSPFKNLIINPYYQFSEYYTPNQKMRLP
jgi:hypothetical protein